MNQRKADIAIVGVYLVLLAMMLAIEWRSRYAIVCGILVVTGIVMAAQRDDQPFPPEERRTLRGLVLVVAAAGAVALHYSYIESCVIWPAFVIVSLLTYVSLRVQVFGERPGDEA